MPNMLKIIVNYKKFHEVYFWQLTVIYLLIENWKNKLQIK